jgi:hypothetical protein
VEYFAEKVNDFVNGLTTLGLAAQREEILIMTKKAEAWKNRLRIKQGAIPEIEGGIVKVSNK